MSDSVADQSTPTLCLKCGEPIECLPMPPMPAWVKSAGWEGWRHLDPTKEHFGPVGWRALAW
jgi:hypothetical protein